MRRICRHASRIEREEARLIDAWNARQARRMPMLFSPRIGAAIASRYWFLWVRCPACRSTSSIDLRKIDRHPDAAVSSLILALSCRSCRPNAPFASLCGYHGPASPTKGARRLPASARRVKSYSQTQTVALTGRSVCVSLRIRPGRSRRWQGAD